MPAGIFRSKNHIQVSVPACPLGFFSESVISWFIVSHSVRLVLRFLRSLMRFRRSYFSWTFIQGISLLRTALMGTASSATGGYRRPPNVWTGLDDDTAWIPLSRQFRRRSQSALGLLRHLLVCTRSTLMSSPRKSCNGRWSAPYSGMSSHEKRPVITESTSETSGLLIQAH